MQKLDFAQKLREISDALLSPQIHAITSADVESVFQSNQAWDPGKILPLLIESKSRYDALMQDEYTRRILELIGAPSLYATAVFTDIVRRVSQATHTHGIYYGPFFRVHVFHEVLQKQLSILSTILLPNPERFGSSSVNEGISVLQISESDLNLNLLLRILELTRELFEIIEGIVHPGEELKSPEILLIDSGSPTSIAVKTTAEVAKTCAEVFREMWQFFVYRKYYDNKVEMESLSVNLSILSQIREAEKNHVLTPEKAKEYATLVERKTDELIGLKVLPREIAVEITTQNNITLLQDIVARKNLTSGDSTTGSTSSETNLGNTETENNEPV